MPSAPAAATHHRHYVGDAKDIVAGEIFAEL